MNSTAYPPGAKAPIGGDYAVTTMSGHYLATVYVGEGNRFPDSAEVAGPGVEVRYVLIEPRSYGLAA